MINSTLNPYLNSNTSLGIDQAYFSILNLYFNPIIFYAIAWEAYTVCIYFFLKLIHIIHITYM